MRRPNPCIAFLCAAAAAAVFGAAGARADGLPVLGIDVGGTGVASSSGDARYVTMPAGRDTVLARMSPGGGQVVASTLLHGTFTIPAVAYDASAGGLSADGKTLVVIQPRVSFPRARTALMAVDTRQLRPSRAIDLKGDFSFDAISPHGSLLYLIQYVSPSDPTRYLVRAYDLRTGSLLARPVVDPRKRSDRMRGSPLTRATSPDGRWAYTLYDGAGGTPFVHALDTSTRTARCIDLPALAGTNVWQLRFHLDRTGRTLTLANGRHPVRAIDTASFATRTPAAPMAGIPWTLILVAVLGSLLAAAALAVVLRRRLLRRRVPALIRPDRTPVRAS
jgi:hypothetical protein